MNWMVIFAKSTMGIVWFFFEEFFWKETLKTKKYEHKTSLFTLQKVYYLSISCQNSDFGARVRYRLSSDLILNSDFNFGHEEFKN